VQLGGAGMRMDEALHQAAMPAAVVGTGPADFVIGIGFLLVGFLLHGLIGVREEHLSTMRSRLNGERAVKISVAPKKPLRKEKWYWIDISI
jgi:hypothetical protein